MEWSLHQPTENEWHWTGDADVVEFINIAQEEGLFVLLRPGPYICAERDFVSISRKCCIFQFSISSFMKINNVLYLGRTSILVTSTSAGHKFAHKRSTWEFLTIFNCSLFFKIYPVIEVFLSLCRIHEIRRNIFKRNIGQSSALPKRKWRTYNNGSGTKKILSSCQYFTINSYYFNRNDNSFGKGHVLARS